MTFLPIVGRELRVAARHKFTWRGRVAAAALALAIFIVVQILSELDRGIGIGISVGQVEFAILKWMCFVIAGSIGVFLTADVLSEEKREGTLGLLFLTDLRGYDIVLGKLMSQSLLAFYALLAAFPILGLTILVGGVTGPEFGRVVLVLCNTLFFSLALGMFVSAISRDSTRAMTAALLLSLLLVPGLPFADFALTGFEPSKWRAVLSLASPGYLFYETGAYPFKLFWHCLGLQHLMAWIFLALASLLAPRSWQEKAVRNSSRPSFFGRMRFGGCRARLRFRKLFLEPNPIVWLALRDRWLPRLIWTLTVVALPVLVWQMFLRYQMLEFQVAQMKAVAANTNGSAAAASSVFASASYRVVTIHYQFASLVSSLIWLMSYFWMVSQAARFFVDAIRQGALELILVTPVGPREIVSGAWRGLRKTFLFPVIYLIVARVAAVVVSLIQASQMNALNKSPAIQSNSDPASLQIALVVLNLVSIVLGLAALGWFGMWMGLTNRKAWVAVLKTICFVYVLPGLVLIFIQIFAVRLMILDELPFWVSQVCISCLGIGIHLGLIFWARKRLLTRFRDVVTGEPRAKSRRFLPAGAPVRIPTENMLG